MLWEERNERLLLSACSLLAAAVLLLLCSMSSPLYPINIWDDANCLLTVGRVMKEGGVLYRDIYEQKGPLLYGIHALAAMISDSSFLGVYLMEVLAFAATLRFAQKTLRLWINRTASWTGMLLFGSAVVISRAFSRGDSAEEFCLPFLMAVLYIVCAQEKRGSNALEAKPLFVLGLLAGCVAAIKFTVLGFFLGVCFAQGLGQLGRRDFRGVLVSAGAFLAGMLLAAAPWLCYFAAHGALEDAYTAYIHNNVFLYNAGAGDAGEKLLSAVYAVWNNLFFMLPALLGVGAACWRRGFVRLAVLLGALCAFAAVFLLGSIYPYYPLVLCVFAPLGLACVLRKLENMPQKGLLALAASLSLAAALLLSPNAFLRGVKLEDTAQGRLAAKIEPGATLLQYSHLDDGLYLASGALPQEKYFVRLNVNLNEMQEALDEAVREGRPDYVLVSWRELPAEFERYALIAYDTGYNDEGRLNKDFYLYKRVE